MESKVAAAPAPPNSVSKKKPKLLHACVKRTTQELPEEIMNREILMRLPVETLVRLRSVCKSWDSLLLTPEYIQSHFTSTINKNSVYNDCLLAQKTDGFAIFSRYKETRIELPLTGLRLVGSINGLVCLANTGNFFLWNPMIGRYKEFTLPQEYSKYYNANHKNYKYLVGFGWDYIENDFLVVVCYLSAHSRQGAIYSSNSDSWTKLVVPHFLYPSHIFNSSAQLAHFMTPSTIVKECPYWCYSKYLPQMRCGYTSIVKFEIRTHKFMLLPKYDPAMVRGKEFNFVNVKDCLAVMVYKSEFSCRVESLNKSVEVHLLQEECGIWSKMYTIGPIQSNLLIWYPLQGFKCGDEIVVRSNLRILCYDPKTDEINLLGCGKGSVLHCFTYTASLVFLQGMKRVQTWRQNHQGSDSPSMNEGGERHDHQI